MTTTFLRSRALALGIAVALAIDAYVHLTSASSYDPGSGVLISEGNLFRAEALVSGAAAALVLIRPSRWTFVAALVVAASALGAVVLYRYVNVGAIGPLPNLYEPTWQVPGKLPSAYAEGIAVLLSAVGVAITWARRLASSPISLVSENVSASQLPPCLGTVSAGREHG